PARDFQGHERRAELIPLGLVRLECTLLRLELDIGPRGEERGERQGFEVVPRETAVSIGEGELFEGFRPGVPREGVTTRLQRIRASRRSRCGLAHCGHCAPESVFE